MARIERILIVGGGIAGLTLATALHRNGLHAELVERSTSWDAPGAGILLHANGVRMLRTLGLSEAVEQAGTIVRRWRFFDQQGEVLCDIDLEELWRGVGPCIGIERPRLQEILLDGAAAVPYRLGTSITSLTQDKHRVSVGMSSGEARDYDLVVGADGIYSTVRRLMLGSVPPGYTGLMVWRSLVPTRPRGVTDFMVLQGDGCIFGVVPMGDRHTTALGSRARRASTTRCTAVWNAFASASRASADRYQSIWPRSLVTSSSTAAPSSGWNSTGGTAVAPCSSATRHMPVHPTWPREAVWRWRMHVYWPRSCAKPRAWRALWIPMSPGADRESTGSSSKVVSGPRAYSCHLPSAMPLCASGEIR
jgi:2-polyprenyl-6-methoxyphenol hydroxylase-like FAD-dependent oxidoreductase